MSLDSALHGPTYPGRGGGNDRGLLTRFHGARHIRRLLSPTNGGSGWHGESSSTPISAGTYRLPPSGGPTRRIGIWCFLSALPIRDNAQSGRPTRSPPLPSPLSLPKLTVFPTQISLRCW